MRPRLLLQREKRRDITTAQSQARDTTTTAARPPRSADAGSVRLSQRDIDGLMLCGEHYGAPADLLALALRVNHDRLPAMVVAQIFTWRTVDKLGMPTIAARLTATKIPATPDPWRICSKPRWCTKLSPRPQSTRIFGGRVGWNGCG